MRVDKSGNLYTKSTISNIYKCLNSSTNKITKKPF